MLACHPTRFLTFYPKSIYIYFQAWLSYQLLWEDFLSRRKKQGFLQIGYNHQTLSEWKHHHRLISVAHQEDRCSQSYHQRLLISEKTKKKTKHFYKANKSQDHCWEIKIIIYLSLSFFIKEITFMPRLMHERK